MQAKWIVLITWLCCLLPIRAQAANLTDACVEDYSAAVDYFPEKVEIVDAENFSVEYFGHYKVVRVADAFAGAPTFEYVLVQCGTPMPAAEDFAAGTQFIEVPTGDVIALSRRGRPRCMTILSANTRRRGGWQGVPLWRNDRLFC